MKVLIEEIVAGHERHAKAANAPHEGLLKSERGTSRVSMKASLAFGLLTQTRTLLFAPPQLFSFLFVSSEAWP